MNMGGGGKGGLSSMFGGFMGGDSDGEIGDLFGGGGSTMSFSTSTMGGGMGESVSS